MLLLSLLDPVQQALHDKDDIVEALRARLAISASKVAAAEEAAATGGGLGTAAGSSALQLSEENAALTAASRSLEAKVRELESQAVRHREEVLALRRLTLEMQVCTPTSGGSMSPHLQDH